MSVGFGVAQILGSTSAVCCLLNFTTGFGVDSVSRIDKDSRIGFTLESIDKWLDISPDLHPSYATGPATISPGSCVKDFPMRI
jgi:hypothetical protein